jgi:galactokinase
MPNRKPVEGTHAAPITPESVMAGFVARFGVVPTLFRAPARVNIIGEHTDYNNGLVLPTTTGLYTWVAASPRSDRSVHVYSENFKQQRTFDLDDDKKETPPEWVSYIQGVSLMIEDSGTELCGADIYVVGEIPVGGGLSSSASLEVVAGSALLAVAGKTLPMPELARLCQRAEVEYVGLACGIMDQLAVACCAPDTAMMLDCRNNEWEAVRLPEGLEMLLIHSGVKHQLPDGDYNNRGEECRMALNDLAKAIPGLEGLSDLQPSDLPSCREHLGDLLYRRCRHVVTENQRTVAARNALVANDLQSLGDLIRECHVSLRDDFEVSCSELNTLVDIANRCDGVLGARMVGAGFGGCVVAMIKTESLENCRKAITDDYAGVLGRTPWSHVVTTAEPAQMVRLWSGTCQ